MRSDPLRFQPVALVLHDLLAKRRIMRFELFISGRKSECLLKSHVRCEVLVGAFVGEAKIIKRTGRGGIQVGSPSQPVCGAIELLRRELHITEPHQGFETGRPRGDCLLERRFGFAIISGLLSRHA